MNDEARMTKDEGMTKHEVLFARQSTSFAVITSRLRECGRIARILLSFRA